MEYIQLAKLYQDIEKTTRRLFILNKLINFLKEVPEEDLKYVVPLLVGRVLPKWSDKELRMGEKLVIRAIALAYGVDRSEVEKLWSKFGDLGNAAEYLCAHRKQVVLFREKLTIKKVFNNLIKIAEAEGEGSIDRKVTLLADLLTSAEPIEARYIVRTVLEELRIGIGEGMMRDAITWSTFAKVVGYYSICPSCLSIAPKVEAKCPVCNGPLFGGEDIATEIRFLAAKVGNIKILADERWKEVLKNVKAEVTFDSIKSPEDCLKYDLRNFDIIVPNDYDAGQKIGEYIVNLVQRAYYILNDFGEVAYICRKEGIEGLRKVKIQVGRPISPMLGYAVQSIEEAFMRAGKPAIIEFKYDGFRMQIHKKGDKIWLFTRRLEDVTKHFPDVVEYVKEALLPEECIVEGETIGYDPQTGKWLPFQKISQRIKRKYHIQEMIKKIPVRTFLFDVIYVDGKSLIDLPLKERRKILEQIIKPIPGKIEIAECLITDSVEEAEKFYHKALNLGNEGVFIKNLNSPYKLGQRTYDWIKLKPTMETLDLVIVGAEWGEGRRANLLSSFLLACRDPYSGELLTIGKMGSGLTDEELKALTEELKGLIIEEKGKEVKLVPKVVVEVAYQEIQKSPKYTSGFALRFPRLVRIREDKSPEEADTIEKVKQLYLMQRGGL